VPGSRLDIQLDPPDPGPGQATILTISVSGSRGTDRYAVTNARVDVALTEKPDDQATLDASSLTTDVTGSATVTLTTSRTRGRHVVEATSGGVSKQVLVDTLAGSQAGGGRARHSGSVVSPVAPAVNPYYLVLAAGAILLV